MHMCLRMCMHTVDQTSGDGFGESIERSIFFCQGDQGETLFASNLLLFTSRETASAFRFFHSYVPIGAAVIVKRHWVMLCLMCH